MVKTASVRWIEDFELVGQNERGHKLKMDTGSNAVAASPSVLLLQALAGCTMMDCILILTKARKKPEKFRVDIEAEEAETHPKVFTKIHLIYNFTGSALDSPVIERAIRLSEQKYCRIHAMLSGKVNITSSYKIHPTLDVLTPVLD